jgi:hypothetical protein
VAWVAWSLVFAGGCAAVTGLDQISEQDCAPLCSDAQADDALAARDVTADVHADGPSTSDSTSDQSSLGHPAEDSASHAEASTQDAAHVGSPSEGGPVDTGVPAIDAPEEAPPEASADAPPEAPADAPFDSGCGPLNTLDDCSACTDKCASTTTVETSSTCSGSTDGVGATCSYTCASGYQDCNAANVPNLDGCECHVVGATQAECCLGTGSCPVAHNNGLNQASSRFFDCESAGEFTLPLAVDACVAFTGDATECTQDECFVADGAADGDLVVCSAGSPTDCVCWTYQGPNAGTFLDPHMAPGNVQQNCFCASKAEGDPSYD